MKKRKSKFMERLEKIQLEHQKEKKTKSPGDSGPTKISLHDKDNPVPWICTLYEKPPYYTPVDILVDAKPMDDWNRVSDGDQDYYVNGRDNRCTANVTHWRKRKGIKYEPYNPMTIEDIPVLSTNDVSDLIDELNKEQGTQDSVDFDMAINWVIVVIKRTLQEKSKSTILRTDTSICKTGDLLKSKK
jgi:hypothetical protein